MADSDDDLFRQAMDDVKPIKTQQRVALKTEAVDNNTLQLRRRAAIAEAAQTREALSGDFIKPLSSHDPLDFKRPGVQHGVYRNLRLGKYPIDARLDLHRMSVDQARAAVAQFVRDCVDHDVRCALINHGKGNHHKEDDGKVLRGNNDVGEAKPALLKSCVAHWLPQLPEVLAFHSAQKQHGGLGASYVLLRKSEKKRQENLERHQKRR